MWVGVHETCEEDLVGEGSNQLLVNLKTHRPDGLGIGSHLI